MKKKRVEKNIPVKWRLNDLFSGDSDPRIEEKRKDIESAAHAFISKWKKRTDYLKDPAVLLNALDEYERWKRYYGTDGDEGYYFWLRTQQDQNNPDIKAKYNKIEEFSKKIENDMQFFSLRIAKIPASLQKRFLEYPGLKKYRHFLERIFTESKYLLSEKEERILNLKASTSYSNWVRMTSAFLAREQRKVLSEGRVIEDKTLPELLTLMNSKDKKVRDSAAKVFNSILKRHVDVAENEINSILANKKVDDELRGFSRPDQARHVSDDIDTEIVDTLVKTVSDRFDISARYYRLKARLLKTRRLEYHERNVEYGKIDKKYTFEETLRLTGKVFEALDREFSEILNRFISEGRFDVFPARGKVGGAFCAHHLPIHPTYILLNHTDKLNDVLTLAHEMGHGINNELIKKRQSSLNFGTPLSTAEVASTFMEDFVLQEIMKESDKEERLALMMMKLNDDVSTVFRQIACYRFEQDLHHNFREKGYLSSEEIGRCFQKHMAAYMGDYVKQSAGSENWWIYWSHIRNYFYVYSYASGLLISKTLQRLVKSDHSFILKVKEFLSAGMSDSPRNIFMRLGIDITDGEFWKRGLDEIEDLLEKTESLAVKLGKI